MLMRHSRPRALRIKSLTPTPRPSLYQYIRVEPLSYWRNGIAAPSHQEICLNQRAGSLVDPNPRVSRDGQPIKPAGIQVRVLVNVGQEVIQTVVGRVESCPDGACEIGASLNAAGLIGRRVKSHANAAISTSSYTRGAHGDIQDCGVCNDIVAAAVIGHDSKRIGARQHRQRGRNGHSGGRRGRGTAGKSNRGRRERCAGASGQIRGAQIDIHIPVAGPRYGDHIGSVAPGRDRVRRLRSSSDSRQNWSCGGCASETSQDCEKGAEEGRLFVCCRVFRNVHHTCNNVWPNRDGSIGTKSGKRPGQSPTLSPGKLRG